MLAAITQARVSIDLEQYILSNDDVGREFIDTLRERARAGVRVRVLCDTVGSWFLYNSPLPKMMRADGIEIRFFNIVSPWRIGSFLSWFFRDHRKILIVDKTIGFTGGIGIQDNMHSWRDTNIKVSGKVVEEMSVAFQEMWEQAINNDLISRIKRAAFNMRGVHFITNAPYWNKHFLYKNFIEAIRNAQSHIYLTTPYFVPSAKFRRALELARRRKVDVRILVPKHSNEPFVTRASHSYYDELLRYGVKIYHYDEPFLHAKTAVIDDTWATVGSFNLDSLSFLYNYEGNVVSGEKPFVERVKKDFLEDIQHSEEVRPDAWAQRGVLAQIQEKMVVPLRRFL